MQFKAVIFDLDGTLFDTLADLADSMNRVLECNRLPRHEVSAYRYFVGDGIEMLVRRALPFEVESEREFQRLVRAMKTEYGQRWLNTTRPYPGVPELLAACVAVGLETAVLSNKPDDATNELVRALLPGHPFCKVLGATAERPKKPHPAAALEIASRLHIPPRHVLFLGDSAVDMQTALAAGMFPVGALWGFRSADELLAAGARMLLKEPADLISWIN